MYPHPNLNVKTFDLYDVVRKFVVNFVHTFIGSCFLYFQYYLFLSRLLCLQLMPSEKSESLVDVSEEFGYESGSSGKDSFCTFNLRSEESVAGVLSMNFFHQW